MSRYDGTYDIASSYEDNYQKGPFIQEAPPQRVISPTHTFLGFAVNSRLGVPAGPLLNANWILAYASLGFDLLVYKTVRTVATPSHPHPNCIFLETKGLIKEQDFGNRLLATTKQPSVIDEISITNSFGMPSRDPKMWQEDIQKAKRGLGKGQVLIVSVVGTPDQGNLANDYAKGASLAVDAGADIIEINLSCPNVVGGEGSVFTDPIFSSTISKAVKQAIGSVPLIIKIGYVRDTTKLAEVVKANAPHIDAISSLNTLSFEVVNADGSSALPGRLRSGICGSVIRGCAIEQAKRVVVLRQKEKYDFVIIGVGGVMTTDHIRQFLNCEIDAVMSATGAMWNPHLAYQYWQEGK
ncbi:MAG: dihydroorotate dehydrogenase [Nitrospirae bacterium]|nr:dihydroorotate dehydrogenase [Candidatus Troglogloeales bacterium]